MYKDLFYTLFILLMLDIPEAMDIIIHSFYLFSSERLYFKK